MYSFGTTAYRQYVGESLNITGVVDANPYPTAQWFRDGTLLSTNPPQLQLGVTFIFFSSVMETDNGTYIVNGTNSEGFGTVTIVVMSLCKFTCQFLYPTF